MGRVYRAVDQLVDDEIALKLISPEIAAGPGTIEQFGRELKIARRIVHKNVGRMHDLSEDRGVYFITMEYVPGQDLKGLMRQTGRLTVGKALSLAGQVCQGLAEAHRLGTATGNVKTGNIMIDREGKPGSWISARPVLRRNQGGEPGLVGTPAYMSTRAARRPRGRTRTDITPSGSYSTDADGRAPFRAKTPAALIASTGASFRRILPILNPRSRPLAGLIRRCLEKTGREIPDSEALLAELER